MLILDVTWIWGGVFDFGIELRVKDLEADFWDWLLLSKEDILSVDSVDDGKLEIGYEGRKKKCLVDNVWKED